MPAWFIRSIRDSDLEAICHHRDAMFREMGRPEGELARVREAFRVWLAPRLAACDYLGWTVEDNGGPIAGVGVIVLDLPPHVLHPSDNRRAYILNMYGEPEHRGRGLAKQLMEIVTDHAKSLGIRYLVLHASEAGRPIYAKLGWKSTTEMSLSLPESQ